MKEVTRDQLKKLFKKVKHFRMPPNLEEINFNSLHYFGWYDESDDVAYLITELNNQLEGIRGEITRMPTRVSMMHQCSICQKGREFDEVMLFTAHTKRLPKGVYYQVRGTYICNDYKTCNSDMKNSLQIEKFFNQILYKE
jgi:FBP C-terminal treble-clef zinc-finger